MFFLYLVPNTCKIIFNGCGCVCVCEVLNISIDSNVKTFSSYLPQQTLLIHIFEVYFQSEFISINLTYFQRIMHGILSSKQNPNDHFDILLVCRLNKIDFQAKCFSHLYPPVLIKYMINQPQTDFENFLQILSIIFHLFLLQFGI